MSTLAVTSTLASVFVPIGVTGAVIAVGCALVAAVAVARGAAGLAGGAVGIWIVGALLSMCASFAMLWAPFFVAAGALVAAFVVGGVARMLVRSASRARANAPARVATTTTAAAGATVQSTPSQGAERTVRTPARGIPSRPVTDTIRIAS